MKCIKNELHVSSCGGSVPPPYKWFLGAHASIYAPNVIASGSAVFAQLTVAPNTRTYAECTTLRATIVATGLRLCSADDVTYKPGAR